MNYEKASALYDHDKTLQILRAEHFPLLISFFHLAFKDQNKIVYQQSELSSLLGDYLFRLERQGFTGYKQAPVDYLQKWAQSGYLKRYYDTGDEPMLELSPATEHALKWLDDLNKQQFVGTHSRLLQFFSMLQHMVNKTASPYERVKQLQGERDRIDREIEQIRQGHVVKPDETLLKEEYFLLEETARRLLSDFRQVEENFRELDISTRQTIIKSNTPKGRLLDDIFERQDHLWNTDQGKSFKAFWEFLMSESMQQELEQLIQKMNEIPVVKAIKQSQLVDRIKTNLVDAGDKVNRSNDGLIEQLRKFVEQKSLSENRYILQQIEAIEQHLIDYRDSLDTTLNLMEIDGQFRPAFPMERPLFAPPVKQLFQQSTITDGLADADTGALFEQFFVDVELLRAQLQIMLKQRSQVSLGEVLTQFEPTKGIAEVLAYMQIAVGDGRHVIDNEKQETILVYNQLSDAIYELSAPLIIFNK